MSNTQFQLANGLRGAECSASAMSNRIVPEPAQFLELGYGQDRGSHGTTDQSSANKYGTKVTNNRVTISEALLRAVEFAKRDLDKATLVVKDRLPLETGGFYQGDSNASIGITLHRSDGSRMPSEQPNWYEHTAITGNEVFRLDDLSGEPFDQWRQVMRCNTSKGVAYNSLADRINAETHLGFIEGAAMATRAGIDQTPLARSPSGGDLHSSKSFYAVHPGAGTSRDSYRHWTADVRPQNSQYSHALQSGYEANEKTPRSKEGSRSVVPPVGSRKRKQRKPRKCLPLDDPTFRGATVVIKTMKYRGDYRLEMSAYYSGIDFKRGDHKSTRIPISLSSDSQSDDELPPAVDQTKRSQIYGKQCASCGTRKTPLWRDAEDGTPLCNACGIRYKKYRTRCLRCWMIPRKETKPTGKCTKCGTMLKAQWQTQRSRLW